MLNRAKKIWIPSISEGKLLQLLRTIRPVMYFEGHGLCFIKPPQTLFAQLYFPLEYWFNPHPEKKAAKLKKLCELKTYHMYGCNRKFEPLVSEVLAQIPEIWLKKVVAFAFTQTPDAPYYLREEDAYAAGYHTAWVQLYVKK